MRLLCTLCLGVSRKFHLHFTLMFQLRYYRMVQSLYWLLVSSITWGIWTTLDKQWKVQKVEIRWAIFSKKYIPSAKTLYTEDLSNITFNYLCENLPNSLCHFWNRNSFFTTQLLFIFFSSTFYKSSPSKCKFSNFPLLALKFTKFLMSFLEPRVCFLQKLNHSSVSWDITLPHFFHLKLYMLWTKRTHQSANFQTFDCSHETKFLMSFLKPRVSFPLNFSLLFNVMTDNSSEIF